MYSLVIGALVVIALGIFVLATKMSDRTQGVYMRDTAEYQAAVAERIRPVGQVYMPGEEQAASAPVAETVEAPEPVATAMTGAQVYNMACNACHGTGAAGAPILGNAEQWSERISQGVDVLRKHAIEGFAGSVGVMPPKGGFMNLSDAEVSDAVDYMIEESS